MSKISSISTHVHFLWEMSTVSSISTSVHFLWGMSINSSISTSVYFLSTRLHNVLIKSHIASFECLSYNLMTFFSISDEMLHILPVVRPCMCFILIHFIQELSTVHPVCVITDTFYTRVFYFPPCMCDY
uniref:Uncharacterized protein n=1 Tax=Cacopsylla melanoneura TaxID=428564 RepID=A0A8D8YT28_9HEMI